MMDAVAQKEFAAIVATSADNGKNSSSTFLKLKGDTNEVDDDNDDETVDEVEVKLKPTPTLTKISSTNPPWPGAVLQGMNSK